MDEYESPGRYLHVQGWRSILEARGMLYTGIIGEISSLAARNSGKGLTRIETTKPEAISATSRWTGTWRWKL